jgi:hypothetical protein
MMSIRTLAAALLALAACAGGDVATPDAGDEGGAGGAADSPHVDGGFLPPVDATPCDGMNYKGHCYTLHVSTTNVPWLTAKAKCEQERPGGHLVTFSTPEEVEYVTGGLKPQVRGWIGLDDRATEGTWAWVTGEAVDVTNWRTSEPSNGGSTGNEDCATFSTPADTWRWNDLDCGGGSTPTLSYICELE